MARTLSNPLYKHGFFAGYTDYRYGKPAKPVTLPRIFKGEKRRHVVHEVMDAMRDWRVNQFENEGTMRHGLRSALCSKGERWDRADIEADLIVQESLNTLGAQRPSWEQGQPEYSLSEEYCHWCYRIMPEEHFLGTRSYRFCGVECARAARLSRMEQDGWADTAVGRSARKIILREAAPAKPCAHCGRAYKNVPGGPQTTFCSHQCSTESRRFLTPRPCPQCDNSFQPADNTQVHCSRECAWRGRKKAKIVTCLHCERPFQQKDARNKLCSAACSTAYQIARLPMRECGCCSATFKPTKIVAKYCSKACGLEMGRRRKRKAGSNVIYLTPEIFDGWFRRAA